MYMIVVRKVCVDDDARRLVLPIGRILVVVVFIVELATASNEIKERARRDGTRAHQRQSE